MGEKHPHNGGVKIKHYQASNQSFAVFSNGRWTKDCLAIGYSFITAALFPASPAVSYHASHLDSPHKHLQLASVTQTPWTMTRQALINLEKDFLFHPTSYFLTSQRRLHGPWPLPHSAVRNARWLLIT